MRDYLLLGRTCMVVAAIAVSTATAHAIDTTSPTVEFVTPKARDYIKSLPAIQAIARDNVGVTSANLYLRRKSDSKYWNGTNWVTDNSFLPMTVANSGSSNPLSRTTSLPQPGAESATKLTEDRYYATIYAYDAAGNFAIIASSVDVDRTAPVPTITSPSAGSFISSLPVARGTATDNEGGTGVERVTFLLRRSRDGAFWNGTQWLAAQTQLATTRTSASWTSAATLPRDANLEEGQYTIYSYAYDRAGNRNDLAVRLEFTVDKTAPTLFFDNPVNNTALKKLELLRGKAADTSGKISRVSLSLRRHADGAYWNGTSWVTASHSLEAALDGTIFRYTKVPLAGSNTSTQIQDGLYVGTAYSYDAAGNRSAEYARTYVTIDTASPSGSVTAPANGATGLTALTRVAGTATDSGSGIASVQITFSRPTSTGGLEIWARRSGVFGWATTAGDLPVANVSAVGSRSTSWAAETNLPLGTNLRNGQHYVAAAIIDRAGNRFVTNVNGFTVGAAVADSVKVNSPANGATVASLPAIEGRANDAQGVSKIAIALSRRTPAGTIEVWGFRASLGWGTTQPTAPLFATVTTASATDTGFRLGSNLPSGTNLAPGAYFVAAQMFDAQNNSITSTVNSFTVTSAAALYAGNYNINWATIPFPNETPSSGTFVLNVSTSGVATAQLTLEDDKFNTLEGTYRAVSDGITEDEGEIYLKKTILGDSYAGSYAGKVYSTMEDAVYDATATVSTSGVLSLKVTDHAGIITTYTGTVNMTTGTLSINKGDLAISGNLLRHNGIIKIVGTVAANGVVTAELQSDQSDYSDDTFNGDLDSVGTGPLRGKGVFTDVDSDGTSEPAANWTSTKQ